MNPYSESSFFSFFLVFAKRLALFLTGQLSFSSLASDEIQILVLIGITISGALVGTFLILRKMTMLANSVSHTILLGIVGAYFFTYAKGIALDHEPININAMLIASCLTAIATTYLTELLTKTFRLQEDASTGLVFTSLFSLGIVFVTILSRSAHVGTEVVMGNVDALHIDDSILVWLIVAINVLLIVVFFKEYQITTFDPGLASAFGISPLFFHYLLMTQVSFTVVGGFRAVGVLMILAFLTGPSLIARFLTNRLKHVLYISIIIGILATFFGVALSRHLLTVHGIALSTSGIVVSTIFLMFLSVAIGKKARASFFLLANRSE